MPKKSRRVRAKTKEDQKLLAKKESKPAEQELHITEPKSQKHSPELATTLSQSNRYQHITPELIRIGIIAGTLIIILIIISFIIG